MENKNYIFHHSVIAANKNYHVEYYVVSCLSAIKCENTACVITISLVLVL